MELDEFFKHHGIRPGSRPFDNSKDAKTDTVFTNIMTTSRHNDWGLFFGDEKTPSTAVIFGDRGSGKTALRLQMLEKMRTYNEEKKQDRVLVVDYVDFNPFLAAFQSNMERKKKQTQEIFAHWRMHDHLDAILSLAVTQYIDEYLRDKKKNKLTPDQQQKMLNLSLLYDSKIRGGQIDRFTQLARLLSVFTIRNLLARKSDVLFGIAGLFVAIVFIKLALFKFDALQLYLVLAAFITLVAGLIPGWNRSRRSRKAAQQCFDAIMVLPTDANEQNSLCCAFRSLPGDRFKNLILPRAFDGNERNAPPAEENRYKYLQFFQDIIVISGYTGILVFVDQVDEPTMVQGDPKKMWAFIRSMMDNKLLSVKNMGIKFLLFRGLHKEYQREEDGFLSKSRLDKQNVVWSLEWGGANLLDLANHRLADCLVDPGKATDVKSLFDKCLHDRLVSEFGNCRTPRKLFEFLNTTIKIHISKHPSSEPVYIINETSFELAKKECRDP